MGFTTQPKSKPIDGEVTNYGMLPPAADNGGRVYLAELEQGSKWTLSYKKAGQYRSNGTKWVYMGAEIPKATTAEIADGTGTDVKRMSVKDVVDITAAHVPTLPSMSLAERNALTETADRAVSPNDIRVAIESKLPDEASTTDMVDLSSTEIKAYTPKKIGDAIDGKALPSMTLGERNALTETGDRAMSPNDIRVAIEDKALPSMTLGERNALTETADRAISPNDLGVAIESKLPDQVTTAEIDALTSTDVKGFSPKDVGDALDSALPSMSLAERNAMTETGDRAMSPNDVRVAIGNETPDNVTTAEITAGTSTDFVNMKVQDVVAIASHIATIDLKTIREDSTSYVIDKGGRYQLDGTWDILKTIVIDTKEPVEIVGVNKALLENSSVCIEATSGSHVTLRNLDIQSPSKECITSGVGAHLFINSCTFTTPKSGILFEGGTLFADNTTFTTGEGFDGIHLKETTHTFNKIKFKNCTFLKGYDKFNHIKYAVRVDCACDFVVFDGCTLLNDPEDGIGLVVWKDHSTTVLITIVNCFLYGEVLYIPYVTETSGIWTHLNFSGCYGSDEAVYAQSKKASEVSQVMHDRTYNVVASVAIERLKPTTWTIIGATAASPEFREGKEVVHLGQGVAILGCSVELRTPEPNGQFRWAQLELFEKVPAASGAFGAFDYISIMSRNQGMANSVGVEGYDYACLSFTHLVNNPNINDRREYRLAITCSDRAAFFRDLTLNMVNIRTPLPLS